MTDELACCSDCGTPLPAGAAHVLCPKCLLQLGFDSLPESDATTSPYQPKFLPPTIESLDSYFPEYELLEVIGHGGMGVVYKARQIELDRLVAIKILRPDIEKDPSFAERFQREARTLAQLDHPNIITIHNFGRQDALYYLVMEYVDGTNLRELERTAQLKPAEALLIVPKICDALHYAHQRGVVHRDIKPENILITQDGRIKIADFGLAKLSGQEGDLGLTGTWQIMGTPHYMAPEQFERPNEVDHRADIFSLGVVIYEMLTGELPLGRFSLPSEKTQSDQRLDDVVERALKKERDQRYQQVSDVKSAVEEISSTPAHERQTYGQKLREQLFGRSEPTSSGATEKNSQEFNQQDIELLNKASIHLLVLAILNIVSAVLFLPVAYANLFMIGGLLQGPAILVLRDFIASRQNLQTARMLAVFSVLPLSCLWLANVLILFLFCLLHRLWKPQAEAYFTEVAWPDTAAAARIRQGKKYLKGLFTSFIDLLKATWNQRTRLAEIFLSSIRLCRKKIGQAIPLILGIAIWSAMWGGAAYITEEYLMDEFAPAKYELRDRTARRLVPKSVAYEALELIASGEGRAYGKSIPRNERLRTLVELDLIPHDFGEPRKSSSIHVFKDGMQVVVQYEYDRYGETVRFTKEFLTGWMENAGIDLKNQAVQDELDEIYWSTTSLLSTGGISRDANGDVQFTPAAGYFSPELFEVKNRGEIDFSVRTDRDVRFALEAFAIGVWLAGIIYILIVVIRTWFITQNQLTQKETYQKLIRWPARGLILCSLVGALFTYIICQRFSPQLISEQLSLGDWMLNGRLLLMILILACWAYLLTLLIGTTLTFVVHPWLLWIGVFAGLIMMIIPPWNLVAFPVGFALFYRSLWLRKCEAKVE